jgi:integrase
MRSRSKASASEQLHNAATHGGMEPLARHTGLARRPSGIYYARLRVPDDLRAEIGQTEIFKSLKTSDPRAALSAIADVLRDIRADFQRRREARKVRSPEGHGTLADLQRRIQNDFEKRQALHHSAAALIETMGSLGHLIRTWLKEQDRKLEVVASGIGPTECDAYLDVLNDDLALSQNDDAGIQSQVDTILSENSLAVRPGTAVSDKLRTLIQEGLAHLFRRQISRIEGKSPLPPLMPPELLEVAPLAASASSNASTTARGMTVGELITAYEADPQRARNSPKTALDYALIFRALREQFGSNRQVRDITRQDCENVADLLWKIPRHATKRYPDLTLAQASKFAAEAEARGEPLDKLSTATINSRLGSMVSLFRWAVDKGEIEKNPAKGIFVSDAPGRMGPGRLPFETDELNAIFSAPLYKGCIDDERRYSEPGPNNPQRGRFWVPLISLFMGLRLNEACQLDVADIRRIGGILVIHMEATPDGRKRLKTKESRRDVPVHPELLRIGFSEFVEARRETGDLRLFPELPLGGAGYHSDPTSKWFSRFLQSTGVVRPGTTFHGFRHCWRDALRNADVSDERVCKLGGWAYGKQVHMTYGGGPTIQVLAAEIAKVEYPGLNLSHLTQRRTVQSGSPRALEV